MAKLAKGKLAKIKGTSEIRGTRMATHEDYLRWRNSDSSKGMNDAGETKLPPSSYTVWLKPEKVYTVLQARVRAHWGYRARPGQALLLDSETGHEVYVARELLEAV